MTEEMARKNPASADNAAAMLSNGVCTEKYIN